MFKYRKATQKDLERIWDINIEDNPGDERWVKWKEKYIRYNKEKKAVTFVIVYGTLPVGEGTLLLSPECDAVKGMNCLANGKDIANINALRIQKSFEGNGHVSKLIRLMEKCAAKNGISVLTIGVEAKEARTWAIYQHLGYKEFIMSKEEDGEQVLYYQKRIAEF